MKFAKWHHGWLSILSFCFKLVYSSLGLPRPSAISLWRGLYGPLGGICASVWRQHSEGNEIFRYFSLKTRLQTLSGPSGGRIGHIRSHWTLSDYCFCDSTTPACPCHVDSSALNWYLLIRIGLGKDRSSADANLNWLASTRSAKPNTLLCPFILP